MSQPWYSAMWADLHGAAEHFDPQTFAPFIRQKIDEIPCGSCKESSTRFAQANPPEQVQTREQALYWLCLFHNNASMDAGNGLVNCESDPQGGGYISGHGGKNGFYYGGGGSQGQQGQQSSGKGKGKGKKGKGRQQPQQQQDGSGFASGRLAKPKLQRNG